MWRIFSDYRELARTSHILIDLLVAIAVANAITFLLARQGIPVFDLAGKFADFAKVIITTLALQSGFNTTCLSMFSTSNTGLAKYLKENEIKGTNRKMIEQLYSYFAWAVVVQLLLLFIAITTVIAFLYIPTTSIFLKTTIFIDCLWYFMFFLTSGILYSVSLTLRNISLLYYFLIVSVRNP